MSATVRPPQAAVNSHGQFDPDCPSVDPIVRLAEHLRPLFTDPEAVIEIRALRVKDGSDRDRPQTYSGHFRGDEVEAMATAIVDLAGRFEVGGFYYTLNPILPDRFTVQAPRLRPARGATSDADIREHRYVYIDIDRSKAIAPKESATDAERAAAFALCRRVREYLAAAGWPASPRLSDSGNGYSLIFEMAEPLPVGGGDAIHRALSHLAAKFAGPNGSIDTAVHNPSRITRLPGTLNAKGTPTADRPHRRARVLEYGDGAKLAGDALEKIAALAPASASLPVGTDRPGIAVSHHPGNHATLTFSIEERAIRWLSHVPDAHEGTGGQGERNTLWAARGLVWGFRLSPGDALRILMVHYNPRCHGPWSETGMARKVSEASRPFGKPYGWLLDAEPRQTLQGVIPIDPAIFADLGGSPHVAKTGELAAVGDNARPESIPMRRANSSIGDLDPIEEFARELRDVIGPEPPRMPCRFPKVPEARCTADFARMDFVKFACGKCIPCQNRRRHAEKQMHCRPALARGTHTWTGTGPEWDVLRKRLDRTRERLAITEKIQSVRVTQENGVYFSVLSIPSAMDADLDESIHPVTKHDAAKLLAEAIERIPLKLSKGTWRIKCSRGWKAKKQTKTKADYLVLGKVNFVGGSMDWAEAECKAIGVDANREGLPDIRVEDRLVVNIDGEEQAAEILQRLCGANLHTMMGKSTLAAYERQERRASREAERRAMREYDRDVREVHRSPHLFPWLAEVFGVAAPGGRQVAA